MNSKTSLALIAIFGMLIGVLVGINLDGLFAIPPTNHEAVIKSVQIRDNTFGVQLTPVFIEGGKTIPLSVITMSFTGEIAWSKWEFRSDPKDPSTALAYGMVWGPGTEREYFCEVGRLSTNAYTVYTPSGSTTWSQGTGEGFSYFIVTR